jgi:GNAT superfamily N-acetyltransferase
MQIRAIRPEELAALLSLYRHLNAEDPPPQPEVAQAAWTEAMANPRCRYFGGYHDCALVSSCTITVIPNLTRNARPYALIENVVTHADHRTKGWGKAVLAAALAFAWDSGCYKVMLMTGRKDEAVYRFYESAGFSRHGKQAFIMRTDQQGPLDQPA